MQPFDLVVIGSGPGGYRAAVIGALRGLKVAIVEKGEWGGCCLNRGCVPKKAWHHSAQLIAAQRDFAARGIRGTLTADLAQAWRHQRQVVATVRAGYVDYLQRLGVKAFRGAARFVDARTLLAGDGERLAAGSVIIATGSHPYIPPAMPRQPGRVITTDDLFEHVPPPGRRVAVIGSGAVGIEFAFILSMLGLEVVWLMRQEPLAATLYSVPARKAVLDALEDCGIRPRTGNRVTGCRITGAGVTLELSGGGTERVDWVLLGAGRVPHTDGLDLAAAGIVVDARGHIRVDEHQQTTAQSAYAIGDVTNPAMTANHALAEAVVAVSNILAPRSSRRDDAAVPQVVYTALEAARIGIDEDRAEAAGLEPAIGYAAFGVNPAALGESAERGFVRLLADMDSGRFLGAEIIGRGASELVQLLGVEFGTADGLSRLGGFAYNHPTRAEEILNATETLAARWGLTGRISGRPAGRE